MVRITLEEAREQGYIKEPHVLENGYIHTGDIIKCPYCDGKVEHKNIYLDDIWGSKVEVEWDYVCEECREELGRYVYGHYQYYFVEE